MGHGRYGHIMQHCLRCSSVLLDEVADGALDDVDAFHHLRLGDDQRRSKPNNDKDLLIEMLDN